MADFNVAKAIRSNVVYARHIGWPRRYASIIQVLGFETPPNSPITFAEGVAEWQRTHRLVPDGMLGPQTWRRIRAQLSPSVPQLPVPAWLEHAPAGEGWTAAMIATLRDDTSFLRLRHGGFDIQPQDFRRIADLIEQGDVIVVPQRRRHSASYDHRDDEEDGNMIDVPRRAGPNWRRAQGLIIHETCHAISDVKQIPRQTLEEEAHAFVVQAMFHLHHRIVRPTRDPLTLALSRAARSVAQAISSRRDCPGKRLGRPERCDPAPSGLCRPGRPDAGV